jgi:hypothetical protein
MLSKIPSLTAFGLAAVLMVAAPAMAQSNATPAAPSGMATQHQQMMSGMMKDMAQQMSTMADQLGHGVMNGAQDKQMSGMMHRMSGMTGQPNMSYPEFQKRMGQMRQQMNSMMHAAPGTSAAPAPGATPAKPDVSGGADPHGH